MTSRTRLALLEKRLLFSADWPEPDPDDFLRKFEFVRDRLAALAEIAKQDDRGTRRRGDDVITDADLFSARGL